MATTFPLFQGKGHKIAPVFIVREDKTHRFSTASGPRDSRKDFCALEMADDEMAVLLQEAISELQETRKTTATLIAQNQELVAQNADLPATVKGIVEVQSHAGRQTRKRKVVVAVHTKVKLIFTDLWVSRGYVHVHVHVCLCGDIHVGSHGTC